MIVASHGRPADLGLCLLSLAQQDHDRLEVVVVACPAGSSAVGSGPFAGSVKLVSFAERNLSAARNAGVALAAGEVVAFIDDDAVAEPTWAARLAAPFMDPAVIQAGGFVRGRNGISLQWGAMEIDGSATDHPLEVRTDRASLLHGTAGRAVKTQGTNMAFRRAALVEAGGFDPALRFYLDDADLNLRLAAGGGLTAVVPDAQVLHRSAPGPYRRADRVPRSLHEIGASTAVFLRRHAPGDTAAVEALRHGQRRRLLRHMVAGRIGPEAVAALLATLEDGLTEGAGRRVSPPQFASPPPFLRFPSAGPVPGAVILSRPWSRAKAEARARRAREGGAVVTILHLRPGPRRHRLWLRPDGIWEQSGGVWGASDRSDRWLRLWTPSTRLRREMQRLSAYRPVS